MTDNGLSRYFNRRRSTLHSPATACLKPLLGLAAFCLIVWSMSDPAVAETNDTQATEAQAAEVQSPEDKLGKDKSAKAEVADKTAKDKSSKADQAKDKSKDKAAEGQATEPQETKASGDDRSAADLAKEVLDSMAGQEEQGISESPRLDFLNEGKNPKSIAQLRAMQDHVREVSQRVKEATVNINVGVGQGTGVIVSSDGLILTAAHVIERPRKTAVITFSDGTRARARTLGVEEGKDSGMLQIVSMIKPGSKNARGVRRPAAESDDDDEPESKSDKEKKSGDGSSDDKPDKEKKDSGKKDSGKKDSSDTSETEPAIAEDLPFFPYLDLGISKDLKDGQWVIAVGHPGGLDKDRGMVVRVGRIINRREVAIRTDCTLVGGDSGGPLVDMDGNLIAIHSRIGSRLQDNLHVPVDVYSDTWDMLLSGYKIGESGWLGLTVNSGSRLVSSVADKGPAAKAGVHAGDIITAVDGKKVADKVEIGDALSTRYPYEKISLTLRRGSKEVDVYVTLGEKSEPATVTKKPSKK